MDNIDFYNIITNLKSTDENIIIKTLDVIIELVHQRVIIDPLYAVLRDFITSENEEIRWKLAEIYNITPEHLKLKNATSTEKIKELEFLSDCTVPNMVQDRSERDIEYSMPLLAVLLFDKDDAVRIAAIDTIGSAQSDQQDFILTLPALIKILKENNDKLKLRTVFLFRNAVMSPFEMFDISRYEDIFLSLLNEKYEELKWAAADTLTYFYTKKKQFDAVKKLLDHSDKDIRQEAAGTLTRLYTDISSLIPVLKKLLSDEYDDVRIVSARTLVYKAQKISDVIETIPIIMKNLTHQNNENRIYAGQIVYLMISLLFKNTKHKSSNLNHIKYIDKMIPEIEKSLSDNNEKVVSHISKSLVRYYLWKNLPDKAIDVLDKLSSDFKDQIIKDIEPKEIPKPEKIIRYISDLQAKKLIIDFENIAKNQKTELRLSGEQLSAIKLLELPKEIGEIITLKKINISQNSFKTLPDEIGNLINLENLSATGNNLQCLPPSIGKLKNLKYIYLYRNKLKTLPKEIGMLHSLLFLQLTQNKISKLPKEIGLLENLEDLNLEENCLKSLPNTFGILKNLKRLDLRGNLLEFFPLEMENLQNLESLMLGKNNLYEIPGFVFKLKNLKYLNFSTNNLKRIPIEITELKKLETLEIRSNQIEEIPPEISKLRNLSTLDLTNNKLTKLPSELKLITSLKFLHLYGNNLTNINLLDTNAGRASKILKNL